MKKNSTVIIFLSLIVLNVGLYGYVFMEWSSKAPSSVYRNDATIEGSLVDTTTTTDRTNRTAMSVNNTAETTIENKGIAGHWIVFNLPDNNISKWALKNNGSCDVGDFLGKTDNADITCNYVFDESVNQLDMTLGSEGRSLNVSFLVADEGKPWIGLTNLSGDDPLMIKRYDPSAEPNLMGNWRGFDERQEMSAVFGSGNSIRMMNNDGEAVDQRYDLVPFRNGQKEVPLLRFMLNLRPDRLYFYLPVNDNNFMIIDQTSDFVMDLYRESVWQSGSLPF